MRRDAALVRKLGRALYGQLSHGWQRKIAAHLGVADSTISDVVNGRRPLSDNMRDKVKVAMRGVKS